MVGVNMVSMLKAILDSFVNIVYPALCVKCRKPIYAEENQGYICHECYYSIQRHTPPFCLKCGRGLKDVEGISGGTCRSCANKQYQFYKAYSVCAYDGIIKELIHKFKYNQKLQYKTVFESLFREFLESFNILREVDLIIPIPLHPARLREREYNQSQVMAACVSKIIEKPLMCDILLRIRHTKFQTDLNEEKRIKNITGCFMVKNGDMLKSKNVLLLDDVLTTGITLSEAARTLKEYNPQKVYALTLAS